MSGTKDVGVKTHNVNEKKLPGTEQPPVDPLMAADKMWANDSDKSSRWGTVELSDLPSATYRSTGQEGVEIVKTKVGSISYY